MKKTKFLERTLFFYRKIRYRYESEYWHVARSGSSLKRAGYVTFTSGSRYFRHSKIDWCQKPRLKKKNRWNGSTGKSSANTNNSDIQDHENCDQNSTMRNIIFSFNPKIQLRKKKTISVNTGCNYFVHDDVVAFVVTHL